MSDKPFDSFGFSAAERAELLVILRRALPPGACVWVFGSRARGDHRRYSDVDLLIECPGAACDLTELAGRLEDSELPYRFDLVLDIDCAPEFREKIDREKRLLVSGDSARSC